jgi:hypothetical protein
VGYAIGPGLTTSGFLYSSGTFSLINVITPPALTWGYGINDQSQIAGAYAPGSFPTNFLLTGTHAADVNAPGALSTVATGLNNSGKIVGIFGDGTSGPQSFLYNGNTFQTLSVPGATSARRSASRDSIARAAQLM